MTIEATETQTTVTESTVPKVEATYKTVDEALAEIERLKNINKDVIQKRDEVKTKLRTFEQAQEDAAKAKLEEQGQFKELLEQERKLRTDLETKIKTQAIDSTLKAKLAELGARSVDTVMKLVDKSKIQFDEQGEIVGSSVEDQLNTLKKTDPILFGTGQEATVPKVKRATEAERMGGFEAEIRSAKTQADVARIMAKYNK